MRRTFLLVAVNAFILTLFAGEVIAAGQNYDPLAISGATAPEVIDLTVHDTKRARDIPIRVYLPAGKSPAPVILFSHGLGGSREGNAYTGKHWAARGYVVVAMQHPGSDTSVWRDAPVTQRMAAMRKAANGENFMLRVKDVPAVLDQLERWNKSGVPALTGRMDLTRVGMSGHSFGAVTTQAVSGQVALRGAVSVTDPRIKAAIAFSPSRPKLGGPKQAFGSVRIPWMLMTGTKDVAPIGDADVASRLAVFPALPPGGKYEVVLYNAQHSAFSDRAAPGGAEKRNPNHHRAILALSTAFWDAYLGQDPMAKAWLDGTGPASVLEKDDQWQKK
ncbi:MAG: dienelactone hydrolase [Candidatus Hydrogenedentes bacterium]|nr:dienelactone hydrolase [Candidatus Hydrogenedentota bacterium]